jgi:hypothetical protein
VSERRTQTPAFYSNPIAVTEATAKVVSSPATSVSKTSIAALICERVNAEIRNPRASGKSVGGPRRIVSQDKIMRPNSVGYSLRQIVEQLGVG